MLIMKQVWRPALMVRGSGFRAQAKRRRQSCKLRISKELGPAIQRIGTFVAKDYSPSYEFTFRCPSALCDYILSPWSLQATNENTQRLIRLARIDMRSTDTWRQLNQTKCALTSKASGSSTQLGETKARRSLRDLPNDVIYLVLETVLEQHVKQKHVQSVRYYTAILRTVLGISSAMFEKFLAAQAAKYSARWALGYAAKRSLGRTKKKEGNPELTVLPRELHESQEVENQMGE